MRFESVTAHAFGALSAQRLDFASGMSVCYGPNEAGKSTWHDAVSAGLCGRRRARGPPTGDERDFEERRRPWQGSRWEVSVVVVLEDGRRLEIRHDFDGKVNCRATDLALGRDTSADIMNDGAPDGARLLGLDRRTFPAVACVRQAQLLAVPENANLLQEHLQRAAATAGRDETAAKALVRIADYRREHVGLDRIGTKKPLRLARERLDAALALLEKARRAHASFLDLSARAEEGARRAVQAQNRVRSLRADAAAREAEGARSRVDRARALTARFHEPLQPPTAQDALSTVVSVALAGWIDRPEVRQLKGSSAAELQAELDSLPGPPQGDTLVVPSVERAAVALDSARQRMELHLEERPTAPPGPHASGASVADLLQLARDLGEPAVMVDAAAQGRLDEAQRRRAVLNRLWAAAVVGGALVVIGGVVAGAAGWLVAGFATAGAGVIMALWSSLRQRTAQRRLREDISRLEGEVVGVRVTSQRVEERRREASRQVQMLGLPANPQELRSLAGAAASAEDSLRRIAAWEQRHKEMCEALAGAERSLRDSLQARGVAAAGDVREALERYRRACADRAAIAAQAARRGNLERELGARAESERAQAETLRRRTAACEELRRAATACGVRGDGDEALAERLRIWLANHEKALEVYQAAAREYGELQNLLGDGTLADLETTATRLCERAAQLRLVPGSEGDVTAIHDEPEAELALAENAFEQASTLAGKLAGQVQEREGSLPGVAEAEEELGSASAELDRVRRLDSALAVAQRFLGSAQDRVHRDIAPRLVASVERWLPHVTCGRYQKVAVDPATLEVKVCGANERWCKAAHLSHGTAEQIYLLLRVALAEHLTKPGERCPLILDDVTVQSDEERTLAVLELLHQVSRERQVILFSQEPQVRDWARAHLDPACDRLEELSVLPAAV